MTTTNSIESTKLGWIRSTVWLGALMLIAGGACDPHAPGEDPDGADGGTPIDATIVAPECPAQDAFEYANDDCGNCMVDPTPYRWQGERCVFDPICCTCDGEDCGNRFASYLECSLTHAQCHTVPATLENPGARLIWQAVEGAAGSGPVLMLSGEGLVLGWSDAPAGITWSEPGYQYQEYVGQDAANEIFTELAAVDLQSLAATLPSPGAGCSISMRITWCAECPPIQLDYAAAADLMPAFRYVYWWFDRHFCGHGETQVGWPVATPQNYCEADPHHDD